MTSKQVDAMIGATPHTGVLTYTWDGTDDNGNRVPAGTYNFLSKAHYIGKAGSYIQVSWFGEEPNNTPFL